MLTILIIKETEESDNRLENLQELYNAMNQYDYKIKIKPNGQKKDKGRKKLIESIIRTFFFTAANEVARFIVVVVLPTPPFWFEIDMIFTSTYHCISLIGFFLY